MDEILLEPLEGGDRVTVPDEKTVIGRGPFLQIQDKRVSRNHATLEIKDGKLVLIPIHTNPCFHKIKGEGSQISLPKDKPLILNHSDVFALLPDKLAYRVLYKSHSESANGKREDDKEECSDTEEDNSEEEAETNHKAKSSKPTPVALVKNNATDDEDMALPLEKKRELPKWMVGSSKRVDVSPSGEKSPSKPRVAENASPAKATANKSSPRGRGRPKGTAMASDDEFAGLSDDEKPKGKGSKSKQTGRSKARRSYREVSDDDYEDDFSEEEIKPKPRAGRGRGRGRGRTRRAVSESEGEEESEDEESTPVKKPARRPRAASLKSPGYNDDFVLSDEEFFKEESEEEFSPRKRSKDSDSDFVPDDESDEDWGVKKRAKLAPPPARGGRGRGRGRGRPSPRGKKGGRPPLIRTSSRKRRTYSDDDDFEEEDDDYTPRPSKRRAAATKKRYRDRDNSEDSEEEYEDEEISEDELEPPKKATPSKRGRKPAAAKAQSKAAVIESDEEEEEEEEEESKKRGRRACMFGKKCYRKNPEHFKEYCHPGDESYEEPDEEEKMALKKTRRGRPKRAANTGKKSVHDGASDDDGETNTYDRTDTFLDDGTIDDDDDSSPFEPGDEDSDFEPEEEDIARLKKEAKGFLKNKRMAKPARSK